MEDLKFTQEIKDAWLTALKSGEYIQGGGVLRIVENNGHQTWHCCLGVLSEIHPDMEISSNGRNCIVNGEDLVYVAFEQMFGKEKMEELYRTNDDLDDGKYTAVIPLIEALPVVEP
jgi:hypothetical protein